MEHTEIDTAEMVRAIRDRIYEETKDMSREEFKAYVKRHAAPVIAEAERLSPRHDEPPAG